MQAFARATSLVAAALVIGAAVTACGDDKPAKPASSTSSAASSSVASSTSASGAPASSNAAQPSDFNNLLIKPADIVVPGDTFTLTQTLPVTPAGAEGVFTNQTNLRKVDVTISVYPDAAQAGQAMEGFSQTFTDPQLGVKGPVSPAEVGSKGTVVVGQSPDGAKSVGIVVFTEGKVFTVIELNSPPDDAVQQDFLVDLARKQDAAIKAGLPA